MNRHPSRAFRRWCAALVILVFSWSLPGAAEARVSPIELVKFQLRKPNILIVVESAESMQGLPGENPARYNEVGVDCENGDRFCRLYGQAGRCEFSGMGSHGYVFDEVPVYAGTSNSTNLHTGGTKIITQTDTGSLTTFSTAVLTGTAANTSGETVARSTTVTSVSTGTQTTYQTGTSSNTETYYQTASQSAVRTSNATGTLTGVETYNTTSTLTGVQTYNKTSTLIGTETYNKTTTLTGVATYNSTSTLTGTEAYNPTSTKWSTAQATSLKIGTDTGIVGYWPLDADYYDYSGNMNNGVAAGSPGTVSAVYSSGRSLASGQYVKASPLSAPSSTNSMAVWVKNVGNNFNARQNILTYAPGGNDAGNGLRLFIYQNRFMFDNNTTLNGNTVATGKGVTATPAATDSASWQLVVGTFNGSTWSLYSMLSTNCGSTPTPATASASGVGFSASSNGWCMGDSSSCSGATNYPPSSINVDEVRVWNRVLSATEVKNLCSCDYVSCPAPSGNATWTVTSSPTVTYTSTNTSSRTVSTSNTGTTTNTASKSQNTTNTGTSTDIGNRTQTTTNTGTTTVIESRSQATTNTGTSTNTASRSQTTTNTGTLTSIVSQSSSSTSTQTTGNTATRFSNTFGTGNPTTTVTVFQTSTTTASMSDVASSFPVSSIVFTTNTELQTQTFTKTAIVTATYISQPLPDTDDCNNSTSCSGASYCYLQSTKGCSSNAECTTPGDFCRQLRLTDGTNRIRADSCVASNPLNKICRYQAKSCNSDSDCQGGTSGVDYCVTGTPAQMCQKSGLWCSVADSGVLCNGSDDKCGPATSRMMMVKNAVRRVFLDHAYDDSAVVKMGQMHTYQANALGSTDNLFPYLRLAEPSFDRTETKFLSRSELLKGRDSSGKPCFVESTGPSGTCTIDYGGGGASTTPSVIFTLVSPANNSRYAIPAGDGKTAVHVDDKWANCGLSCSFPSASVAGKGLYEGSYYTFTYRRGVPIDPGSDPNNPILGSVKNPQYYSSYRGKSFGSSGNYWMLMDAERSDIVNENKYGAHGFTGASWSSNAEFGLPFTGAGGDPLSTSVACSSSNGAQWDYNLVPMVNATIFGGRNLTPPQKALLNVARLEKNSFGGFHAVGNIAPVACALKNDTANDSHHSVEGYMNEVKTSDSGACWPNHVLLVVDGLPRGPGDVAVGGIDCSADACRYDTNPSLSGCACPAVAKARSLADSGVDVHVIAASTDPAGVNLYAAKTLNNIAIAGSTSTTFINRPRYAANEDELTFWLNYEMKEALRVRVATTPASAASGSQSLSGVTAGNRLYQTVAELPEWRGSLLGYAIGTVSLTSTSTATSTDTSTSVAYTTTKIWDAALQNGWVPCSPTQAMCSVPDDYRWKSRNVFFSDQSGVVRKINVDSSGSVDSASKAALLAMGMGANASETQRIVQWMLGKLDPSETLNPRPLNPAVMGSVVNSMPISVGPPGMSSQLGANHFYYAHVNRPELVYVGADDGMLHAFYASNGAEAFAFIPADMVPVIAKLYAQGGQRYNPSEHIYGLSGSPKVKNLCVANCNPTSTTACSDEEGGSYNDSTCPQWKTVLVMGEGQGGNHPFALDITEPIAGSEPDITNSLLWHVGYKNANAIAANKLGDTVSVPAFAYKTTTDKLDNRVLLASSYPVTGGSTYLIDAKLMDGSSSGGSGLTISGSGCSGQDFGMVADVALARDYSANGEQSLIAAYLADTHGKIHQYAPFFSSVPDTVMNLGCNHPLHFSPAVVQLNRNDPNNINGTSVFLAQVTNSLMDPATRSSSTPSKLVVKKLTAIGNNPPAADAAFGISGEIHLSAGTSCTGTDCLCGIQEGLKTNTTEGCGAGGQLIPSEARPTGTPVAVLRHDGAGFQLYTTWYQPPASNWDNCPNSATNGTSYITVHEFLANGTWAQIAGIAVSHQYVTGVQFVGTTLFVTYGMNEKSPGSPEGWPNVGQTFVSATNPAQNLASDRFIKTAWAERLDM